MLHIACLNVNYLCHYTIAPFIYLKQLSLTAGLFRMNIPGADEKAELQPETIIIVYSRII